MGVFQSVPLAWSDTLSGIKKQKKGMKMVAKNGGRKVGEGNGKKK